jgi:hypothetical protein
LTCGADRYWEDYATAIPINIEMWGSTVGIEVGCSSVWLAVESSRNDYEILNSEEKELTNAYEMSNVIQLLLAQETDLLYKDEVDYSEFFYGTSNPISGDAFRLFFTPKSNIVNAYYNNPAKKSPIRLREVIEMLWATYKVSYHIEEVGGEKRLRFEHVDWYRKGGNYTEEQLSYDVTTAQDKRNKGFLSNYQNTYNYAKQKMPQRYEFSWGNDVSDAFKGSPINILSNHIEIGQIEKLDAGTFIPDIDTIIGREDISLDGWVIMHTQLILSQYKVTFLNVEVLPGVTISIQNGDLSFQNLHPTYYKYELPSTNIEVNGAATTATTVIRNKQQELTFTAKGVEINPLQLVRTELGDGQVESMKKNILSDTFEMTINHDTE